MSRSEHNYLTKQDALHILYEVNEKTIVSFSKRVVFLKCVPQSIFSTLLCFVVQACLDRNDTFRLNLGNERSKKTNCTQSTGTDSGIGC